jgi:hypothetical protein
VNLCVQPLLFGPGLGGHLGVIARGEFARFGELAVGARQGVGEFDNLGQALMLTPQRRKELRVPNGLRVAKLLFYVGRPRNRVGQQVPQAQAVAFAYF